MQTQQDLVYAAERLVDDGPVFADVATVQSRLNALRDTWWWEQWTPNVVVIEVEEVRPDKHGRTAAGAAAFLHDANVGRIELHRGVELNERRIVHELAHVIAGARKHSHAHDPWFARVYLELTYLIRGSVAYQQLKYAFDTLGVDYDAEGLAPR